MTHTLKKYTMSDFIHSLAYSKWDCTVDYNLEQVKKYIREQEEEDERQN